MQRCIVYQVEKGRVWPDGGDEYEGVKGFERLFCDRLAFYVGGRTECRWFWVCFWILTFRRFSDFWTSIHRIFPLSKRRPRLLCILYVTRFVCLFLYFLTLKVIKYFRLLMFIERKQAAPRKYDVYSSVDTPLSRVFFVEISSHKHERHYSTLCKFSFVPRCICMYKRLRVRSNLETFN